MPFLRRRMPCCSFRVSGGTRSLLLRWGLPTKLCSIREVEFQSPSSLIEIGQKAFFGCDSLTKIEIPDPVESIQESAFAHCTSLEIIKLPKSSLKTIGRNAFENCAKVAELDIPSVATISEGALLMCKSLQSVSLPSSLKTIGDCAFQHCEYLEEVEVPDSVMSMADGVFANCISLKKVKLPKSLPSISDGLFFGCEALTGLHLPDSVSSIGSYSLSGCKAMKSIQLPKSLNTIGAYAMGECEGLEKIDLPPKMTKIGEGAFVDCAALQSIALPSGIKMVDELTFCQCSALRSVQLPDSVQTVGRQAFDGCAELESIDLPPSVRFVGRLCFAECKALHTVIMPQRGIFFGTRAFKGSGNIRAVVGRTGVLERDMRKKARRASTVRRPSQLADESTMHSQTPVPGDEGASNDRAVVPIGIETELDGEDQKDETNEYEDATPPPGTLLRRILDGSEDFNEFIASMFESGNFDFNHLKQSHVDRIVEKTIQSRRMQQALVDLSIRRLPVFFLMLEGYFNVALMITFISAAEKFLLEEINPKAACACLLGIVSYFLLREGVQILYEPLRYMEDFWNFVDIVRVSLVITSATLMINFTPGKEVEDTPRYFILVTGGLVITGVILFLRNSFLPYAEFVGGLIAVFKKLVPFLVVSTLLVFAFSFMYFTTSFEEGFKETLPCEEEGTCFHDMRTAMLTSFSFFFGGPEPTSNWILDLAFGFAIVVILLNVLIAIVSKAWESSVEKGQDIFWAYRIAFLADVESLRTFRFLRNVENKNDDEGKKEVEVKKEGHEEDNTDDADDDSESEQGIRYWLERLDAWGNRTLRDDINWNSHPYRLARDDKEWYDACIRHPNVWDMHEDDDDADDRQLTLSDYDKLHLVGSFERDWHWAGKSECKWRARFAVVVHFLLFVGCLVLGLFPTCGLLWPRRVRRFVFGIRLLEEGGDGRDEELEEKEEKEAKEENGTTKATQRQEATRVLTAKVRQIEADNDVIQTKLDAILQHLQSVPSKR